MTQICPKQTMEMTECVKQNAALIKKEGKCIKEINEMINCVEGELYMMNMMAHI